MENNIYLILIKCIKDNIVIHIFNNLLIESDSYTVVQILICCTINVFFYMYKRVRKCCTNISISLLILSISFRSIERDVRNRNVQRYVKAVKCIVLCFLSTRPTKLVQRSFH